MDGFRPEVLESLDGTGSGVPSEDVDFTYLSRVIRLRQKGAGDGSPYSWELVSQE